MDEEAQFFVGVLLITMNFSGDVGKDMKVEEKKGIVVQLMEKQSKL